MPPSAWSYSFRFLGVILDSNWTFRQHVQELKKKASKKVAGGLQRGKRHLGHVKQDLFRIDLRGPVESHKLWSGTHGQSYQCAGN